MNELVKDVPLEAVPVKEPVKKESRGLDPVYHWESGTMLFLTRKEKVLAEVWLETWDYKECQKKVEEVCGKVLSIQSCSKSLHKPDVRKYMFDLMKDRGYYNSWTKEKLIRVMSEHLAGSQKLNQKDFYLLKLIAEVMGWGNEVSNTQNTQINFVQGNGQI